jgi:hypothetical protein
MYGSMGGGGGGTGRGVLISSFVGGDLCMAYGMIWYVKAMYLKIECYARTAISLVRMTMTVVCYRTSAEENV